MAGTVVTDTIKSGTSGPVTFQNTSGTAIGTLCRAWVNFNGSTAAINASFNVTSITKNGTGDYTVNFTNAMPDANYSGQGSAAKQAGNSAGTVFIPYDATASRTASAYRFLTRNSASASSEDPVPVDVAIFR
jgi:hypothetical protein